MSKETHFSIQDIDFPQTHPDIDAEFKADLPQVPEDQQDISQQTILFSISGQEFHRFDPEIKKNFPELLDIARTETRQVRLVVTTQTDGSGINIEPWHRDIHGEYSNIPTSPLYLQQIKTQLEDIGLDTDPSVENFIGFQLVRNTAKQPGGSSTKYVPKDAKIKPKSTKGIDLT